MNYTIKEDRLFFDGKEIFVAPSRICKSLSNEFNESVIIVYDARKFMPDGEYPMGLPPKVEDGKIQELINQNILCIDRSGNLLWRIEPTFDYPVEFTSIVNRKGDLWAYRFDGYEFKIDQRNGKVVEHRYAK